jgi:hypothetical protein
MPTALQALPHEARKPSDVHGLPSVSVRMIVLHFSRRIALHMSAYDPRAHLRKGYALRVNGKCYGALHATIASGGVRFATVGGATIAR